MAHAISPIVILCIGQSASQGLVGLSIPISLRGTKFCNQSLLGLSQMHSTPTRHKSPYMEFFHQSASGRLLLAMFGRIF